MWTKQRLFPIVVLLASVVCLIFSACSAPGPVTQSGPETTKQAPPTASRPPMSSQNLASADAYLGAQESQNFGGAEFKIATRDPKNYFPSQAGDVIDDLVWERNDKVEKKLNVKLVNYTLSGSNFFESIRAELNSGLFGADLIVGPVDLTQWFVTYSLYSNANVLGLDYSAPYYNSDAMAALSTGSIRYAIAGSYTDSPENAYCVFYNRTNLQKQQKGDLVSLVKNGEWTWNTMLSWATDATSSSSPARMSYGLSSSCDDADFIRMMWAASGVDFFINDPPNNPSLDLDTNLANRIANVIKATRRSSSYYGADEKLYGDALSQFKSGKHLFYISRISDYSSMQGLGFSVGMVPLPKMYDQQAQYSTYVGNDFDVMFLPSGVANLNLTSSVVGALNAASYEWINNAYLNLYAHMYLTSNDEAVFYKDMIHQGYYEIGYLLGDTYNTFASASTDMIYRVVTAGADLRETYKQNQKQFNRFLASNIFDSSAPSATRPAATTTRVPVVTTRPTVTSPNAGPSQAPVTTARPADTPVVIPTTAPVVPGYSTTPPPASTSAQVTASGSASVPVTTRPFVTGLPQTSSSSSAVGSSAASTSSSALTASSAVHTTAASTTAASTTAASTTAASTSSAPASTSEAASTSALVTSSVASTTSAALSTVAPSVSVSATAWDQEG